MEKKYRTEKDLETGLLRIIALKDFSDVKKGDRGGLISSESNLSQEGDCWVYEGTRVYGDAEVFGNAKVCDNAHVRENARVFENARVYGNANISGYAKVSENAEIFEDAQVYDSTWIYGHAQVDGDACVYGEAKVCGGTWVGGKAEIRGDVKLWSTENLFIYTSSIENNKDYIILGNNRGEFHIYSSKIENIITSITLTVADYIKNIKTIRQIYLTPNF